MLGRRPEETMSAALTAATTARSGAASAPVSAEARGRMRVLTVALETASRRAAEAVEKARPNLRGHDNRAGRPPGRRRDRATCAHDAGAARGSRQGTADLAMAETSRR